MRKFIIVAMAAILTACNTSSVSPVKTSRGSDHTSRENIELNTGIEKMFISRARHVIELNNDYDYWEYFAYSESLETEICIASDMLPGCYSVGEIVLYDHTMTTTTKAGN